MIYWQKYYKIINDNIICNERLITVKTSTIATVLKVFFDDNFGQNKQFVLGRIWSYKDDKKQELC